MKNGSGALGGGGEGGGLLAGRATRPISSSEIVGFPGFCDGADRLTQQPKKGERKSVQGFTFAPLTSATEFRERLHLVPQICLVSPLKAVPYFQ